jgi:hypothetical protein
MAYTKSGKAMLEAATARSDLNMFAAVTALMENSLVSSNCYAAEQRIIKICQAEQSKCLARFDAAIKKAGGGTYGRDDPKEGNHAD